MAQVRKDDIVQRDLFRDLATEISKAETSLKSFDDRLKGIAATMQGDLNTNLEKNIQNINKLNVSQKKAESITEQKLTNIKNLSALEKEKISIQKKTLKAQAKIDLQATEEAKNLAKLNEQKKKGAKINRDNAKAKINEKNAYYALSAATIDYKNESKRLGAELLKLGSRTKKNSKKWDKLSKSFHRATESAKIGDKQLKKLDRTVGDNFREVGNYQKATQRLSRALGALGIAFGISTVVRSAGKAISDFDEKVADVQKTTGLASKEAREFSLALFDIDTRTGITALQELASAAGRLGIEGKANLLGFVEAADKVFVALGDELDGTAEDIATNLGKIAAQFGLEKKYGIAGAIERVGSVMNDLAANSKAQASEIFQFTSTLGGLANAAGIAQTDVQALGALFSNFGQSTEVAATTIKKLLPALAEDQARFAKVAGLTADEFSNLLKNAPIDALQAVAVGAKNSAGGLDGLNKTLVDFGIKSGRAAPIVATLANHTEKFVELRERAAKAEKENTSIANEAAIKQQTWNGAIEQAIKSWDKLVIRFNEASGVGKQLKKSLFFIAKNLGTILGVVVRLTAAFLIWKAAQKIGDIIKHWDTFKQSLISTRDAARGAQKSTDGAARSVRKLGKALRSIAVIAIITVILKIAEAFYSIASGARAAKVATDAYNDKLDESTKKYDKAYEKLHGDFVDKNRRLHNELLKGEIDSQESLKKLQNDNLKAYIKSLEEKKKAAEVNAKKLEDVFEKRKEKVKSSSTGLKIWEHVQQASDATVGGLLRSVGLGALTTTNIFDRKSSAEGELKAANEIAEKWSDNLKQAKKDLEDGHAELVKIKDDTKEVNDEQEKGNRANNESETKLADLKQQYESETKLADLKEQYKLNVLNDTINKQRDIYEKADKEHKAAELKRLKELLKDRYDLKLKAIIAEAEIQLDNPELGTTERDVIEQQMKNRKQKLKSGYDAELRGLSSPKDKQEEEGKDLIDTAAKVQKGITDILEEQIDKRLELLKKEQSNIESHADFQKKLAAQGNINAQESIKESIKLQRENEKKQMDLEKKKQRLGMISQGIETYLSLVQNDVKPAAAFAQTVITSKALISFLGNMQGFYKGTDNAPEGMHLTQEKGAEIITDKKGNIKSWGNEKGATLTNLQKGDKVKSATETTKLLNSLDGIDMSRQGGIKSGTGTDERMYKKMSDIEKAITNQPHSYTDWENITDGLGAIRNTTRKGKDKFISKHLIKK